MKISKLVKASALNWSVEWVKILNFHQFAVFFSHHFLIFLDQPNRPTAPTVLLVTAVDLSIVIINFVNTSSVIIVQSLSTSFYCFDISSRSTSSTQPTLRVSSEEKSQFSKRWVTDHHLSWYRCVGLDDRRGRSKSGLLGLLWAFTMHKYKHIWSQHQVGPYIYEEKWDKVDVDWQNDTVSYRLKKSYR